MNFILYTDGGCSGNKRDAGCRGAWAYVLLDSAKNIIHKDCGTCDNTTNNRMELNAIISGLTLLSSTHIAFGLPCKLYECVVLTDSKYVVDNFNDYLPEWKVRRWKKSGGGLVINDDLWKRLDLLIPEFKLVKLQWVKGHANNEFNVLADLMVRSVLYPNK